MWHFFLFMCDSACIVFNAFFLYISQIFKDFLRDVWLSEMEAGPGQAIKEEASVQEAKRVA